VYAKPGTPLEQMVADVWQSILGIEGVGSHDNFFEMGGHSLMAIQLVSRLRELLQVDIGLTALFEFPTVAQLANHIAGKLENVEGKMIDLAMMLDYVEGLSPEEVKALLARQPEN
jgi:acyl carrier protein